MNMKNAVSQKVRVCHITSAHSSNDVRIFQKECTSLATAGYEVYLVAPGESSTVNGVKIVGLGEKPKKRLKRMTTFARKSYQTALALDCDIYHFHDPELLPYGLKLKRKGKTVIFDSHEDIAGQIMGKSYLPRFARSTISAAVRAYERHVMKRIDAVIYVSPHFKDTIQPYSRRSCMVTNFPILKSIPDVEFRDPRLLCFAGGITPLWNHETVLRALETLPEVRYAFCGNAGEAYLAKLRSYPTWDQAEYKGMLSHSDSMVLLRSGAVGMALCSYNENTCGKLGTLGNTKLFEAMALELPVICTDFVLWKEIIDKYKCGVCVAPQDEKSVAAAIHYLLDHPDEAKRMGENGRRAVEDEFNWCVEEKKLLRLYHELAQIVDA